MDFEVLDQYLWRDDLGTGITYTIRCYDDVTCNSYEFLVYGFCGSSELDCTCLRQTVGHGVLVMVGG